MLKQHMYDVAKEAGHRLLMKLFEGEVTRYSFSFTYLDPIPESAITQPHLPPGFWRIGK